MAIDGKVIVSGSNITYAGDDLNNKGFYATGSALSTAFPTGVDGWYAVVGATDSVWVWDDDTTAWVDSGSGFTAGGMLVATYDPTGVADDCFDMDNMAEGSTTKILTDTERTKLTGIEDGAEVNVNADWNGYGDDSEILNKPTIPNSTAGLPDSFNRRYVTDAQLATIASGADYRRNMAVSANGSEGQTISYTSTFVNVRPAIFDYNGLGIQVTSFDADGFTITSLTSGNFGYETKNDM